MTETDLQESPTKAKVEPKARPQTKFRIQARRDLMDGYILTPEGATVGDAIRIGDISIPSYREKILAKGHVILTQYNANSRAADLESSPPTLETCERVMEEIAKRKVKMLEFLQDETEDTRTEVEERDYNRGERNFWRARLKALQAKLEFVEAEEVSAEELYKYFVREDVSLRAKAVPPELRAAMEAVERERALASL